MTNHADYPHTPGTHYGCGACEETMSRAEARNTIRRTESQVARHLKTCTECRALGSDPQFCGEIKATVTEHDEAESLIAGLDELKNSDI